MIQVTKTISADIFEKIAKDQDKYDLQKLYDKVYRLPGVNNAGRISQTEERLKQVASAPSFALRSVLDILTDIQLLLRLEWLPALKNG